MTRSPAGAQRGGTQLRSRCCSFQTSRSSGCDSCPNSGSGVFGGGDDRGGVGVTRGGLASLDTGAAQIRATHFFRKVPGPPRLRMSRQGLHKPHSGARHGPQRPHADERARFFGGASAMVFTESFTALLESLFWLGSVPRKKTSCWSRTNGAHSNRAGLLEF